MPTAAMKHKVRSTPARSATKPVRPVRVRAEEAEQRARIAKAQNVAAVERIRAGYLKHVAGKLPEVLNRPRHGAGAGRSGSGKSGAQGGRFAASGYYENASTGGRLKTVRAMSPRAPWATLDKHTRDSLRRQVQQTERNNVLCRGIINRYVDFTVGDGPGFSFTSSDEAYNAEAKRLILAWMTNTLPDLVGKANLRGMTTYVDDLRETVRAARLVDGDLLKIRTFDQNGFGTLQYIEAERLCNKAQAYTDSDTMCGGVEMNALGQPTAFHIAGWQKNGLTLEQGTYEVPAEHARLIFNPVGFKNNQVRGEPQLQAALDLLDVLNGYIDSTALASEIATYIGAIFKSERPEDMRELMAAAAGNQPPRDNVNEPEEVAFGPAFTHHCKPGEGVEQVKPEFPTTNFKEFVHAVVQIIGADIGLPLVILLYVTEQMSWSNLRGVLAIAARGFEYTQDWLCREVRADIRWKLEEFIARGLLKKVEGWDTFDVKLPMSPVLDLDKEVGGFVRAVENNMMTEQMACEMLGMGVYEDIVKKRGANRRLAEKEGVLPPTMPGAGIQGGNANAQPDAVAA